jgi:hypothetical protein
MRDRLVPCVPSDAAAMIAPIARSRNGSNRAPSENPLCPSAHDCKTPLALRPHEISRFSENEIARDFGLDREALAKPPGCFGVIGSSRVNRFSKLALILAGYVAALFGAFVGVALMEPSDPAQAQGGMQAFGDFLSFWALFGLFSLVPTAYALYNSRGSEKFWRVFSMACLAFAASGPILALLTRRLNESDLLLVGLFALLRVLATPVLCFAFFVFALVAPSRRAREFLLASAALEAAAGGYTFFCLGVLGHWLV